MKSQFKGKVPYLRDLAAFLHKLKFQMKLAAD